MQKTMRSSPNRAKREVVEEGLRILIKTYGQVRIRKPHGKLYPTADRS